MALIVKPNTFSAGTTILSAQVNSNFDTVYNLVNGSLDTANLSGSAGILDTQLAQITSASKVAFSALTAGSTALNLAKGADIASATTTDIGAATGNYVDITGTTTITGLGTVAAGAHRVVQFDGALTLTHNASSLILPGGANITTAAGDTATFISLGSGNWICTQYQLAANAPSETGDIVQTVNTQTGAVATGTTAIPQDDTIPQNTEGDEYMTLAITPTNSSNTLIINVVCNIQGGSTTQTVALFQDSTAGSLCASTISQEGSRVKQHTFSYKMTAGTTSSTTFKIRAGSNSGTTTFNGTSGSRLMGGVFISSITIMEIKA